MRRDWAKRVAAGLVLLAAAAGPGAGGAVAQQRVTGGQFRQQTVVDDTLLRRGRIEISLNFAGAYSSNTVTAEDGTSSTQKNSYLNPALIGGYMLTDNIELRLSIGAQYLGSSIEGGDLSQQTLSGVLTLQGLYQRDFVLGLAGYVGIGGGGYYGYRNVPSPDMPSLNARFNNVGGVGQVMLGLLMQPGARLMLRGGMRVDLLFGSETPADETLMLPSQSTFNIQVIAEMALGWRFG